MATTENEYYLRSILLLADGGSYISKMVLYRELSGDLDTLLKSFKSKLKHELHEKQMEKLFPGHGKTVVDTWDLQMLIIVVLRLFHTSLKVEDRMNLQAVKLLRNEVQAHSPSATLDDVQYDNIKVQLTNALTGLASSFDEDIQKECQLHINKYASGPLDVMSARECLKQLQENDVMFKQVLEKVEQSNNDICDCVNATKTVVSQQISDLEKIMIDRLERLDMGTCRKKIKVGMHVELVLGGPTEEWILLMERTLNDIFNEAYQTSEGKFEDMKKRVEELLEVIKQNTTIKFKGSKTKCIILMFECFTFAGLLDFLQYITSQKYQDRLDALITALSAHFRVDFPVTVTSKIKDECLQNAIDILDTTVEHDEIKQRVEAHQSHSSDEYKKSLRLAMECSSAKDLIYLWKMFQQGGAKQYLDRIADVLSEHSGQRITLTSSIDLEEFTQAIEETAEVGVGADYARRRRAAISEDSAYYSHSTDSVELADAGEFQLHLPIPEVICGRSEDTDFSSRSSAGRSEDSAYYSHSTDSVELADAGDFQLHPLDFRNVILRDDSEDVKSHTQLRSKSVVTSTQTNSSHVWSVESKQSYTIMVEGERRDCIIKGCCMLPTGEILLADYYNCRLKKLDDRYQMISVCDLPGNPRDVCYCGNNEAVLAMGNSLQFVNVRGGMSLTRKVEIYHKCNALTCHGKQLYVADYNSVYIHSTDGITQRILYTHPFDHTLFRQIAVSDDGNYIYITEPYTGLRTIDSVGSRLYTLSDAPSYGTTGVCVDGEGHVLVSMMGSGNVMQLSSDGKQKLGIIVDTISEEELIGTICFNRSNATLIVAGRSNKIHVFKLK